MVRAPTARPARRRRPIPGAGRAGIPLRDLPRRAAALRPQRQRGGVLRLPRGRGGGVRGRVLVAGRAPPVSPARYALAATVALHVGDLLAGARSSSTPCSGTRRRWASGCRGRATSRSRSSPRRRCCSGGWRCGAALAARRSTGSSRCSPSPSWSWRRHRGAVTSAPRSRVPRPLACSRGCSSDAGSASAPSSSSVRCSWWRGCSSGSPTSCVRRTSRPTWAGSSTRWRPEGSATSSSPSVARRPRTSTRSAARACSGSCPSWRSSSGSSGGCTVGGCDPCSARFPSSARRCWRSSWSRSSVTRSTTRGSPSPRSWRWCSSVRWCTWRWSRPGRTGRARPRSPPIRPRPTSPRPGTSAGLIACSRE